MKSLGPLEYHVSRYGYIIWDKPQQATSRSPDIPRDSLGIPRRSDKRPRIPGIPKRRRKSPEAPMDSKKTE